MAWFLVMRERLLFPGSGLGQCDALAGVFEDDFDIHTDLYVFDWAADDVAAEPRPFFKIDPCRDVGNVGRKATERAADDFADDREREDFAATAELFPFQFVATAFTADRPRTPTHD
jgi:hypothetical protein